MTSKTARTNARQKAEAEARLKALYSQWIALLEKNGGSHLPSAEALALGGTEFELTCFLYQYAG